MTNKRGRVVETKEYLGMIRRSLRALTRRVAEKKDIEQLAGMLQLQRDLDAAITSAVAGLRQDYSWQEIADRAGVTRQTAWERWNRKITEMESQ